MHQDIPRFLLQEQELPWWSWKVGPLILDEIVTGMRRDDGEKNVWKGTVKVCGEHPYNGQRGWNFPQGFVLGIRFFLAVVFPYIFQLGWGRFWHRSQMHGDSNSRSKLTLIILNIYIILSVVQVPSHIGWERFPSVEDDFFAPCYSLRSPHPCYFYKSSVPQDHFRGYLACNRRRDLRKCSKDINLSSHRNTLVGPSHYISSGRLASIIVPVLLMGS